VVIGPHDEDFKTSLKARIPAAARHWLAGVRAWSVHESHACTLDEIIVEWSGDLPTEETTLTVAELARCVCEFGTEDFAAGSALADAVGLVGQDVTVLACRTLESGETLALARFTRESEGGTHAE